MTHEVLQGDVLQVLGAMASNSIHCVITSPPYWGLRDYGVEPSIWGGNAKCEHQWGGQERSGKRGDLLPSESSNAGRLGTTDRQDDGSNDGGRFCLTCGAWRGCIGLEPTPELFLSHMVEVFRDVRRVLRPEGTAWVNMGDCYVTQPHGDGHTFDPKYAGRNRMQGYPANRGDQTGLKNKDLVMMPARVALALQADGWYLRSQIPWLKRNSMPESTDDRPATAVEYVFLLSKSEDYYYDREAVRIPASGTAHSRGKGVNPKALPKTTGPNSRMNRAQDPKHQDEAHIRNRQNSSFAAAVKDLVSSRTRRNSDWFFESMASIVDGAQGMLTEPNGGALAIVVNPQPFAVEMCRACDRIYHQPDYRKLALNLTCAACKFEWVQIEGGNPPKECPHCKSSKLVPARTCECTESAWLSHFATFPERLVVPFILAGTSEHGCCGFCGAPYERILERPGVGDWNPAGKAKDGHDKTAPARMAEWTKTDRESAAAERESRLVSKCSSEGSQFSSNRMNQSTTAARSAGKHQAGAPERNGDPVNSLSLVRTHDQPFAPPQHLGWRATCSHPMFPAEVEPCVVADIFSGSGRTGIAALKAGRSYLGIERNPKYVIMQRKLLEEVHLHPEQKWRSIAIKEGSV